MRNLETTKMGAGTAKQLARWLVQVTAPHWPLKRAARSMARRTGFGWKAVRKQLKRLRHEAVDARA